MKISLNMNTPNFSNEGLGGFLPQIVKFPTLDEESKIYESIRTAKNEDYE